MMDHVTVMGNMHQTHVLHVQVVMMVYVMLVTFDLITYSPMVQMLTGTASVIPRVCVSSLHANQAWSIRSA